MKLKHSKELALRRRTRIRHKISGEASRPRLSVRFSQKHIYAQVIDDRAGRTLASASSLAKDLREKKLRPNLAGAKVLGEHLAGAAQKAGVVTVVFDRGGRRYHGCVKVFADAARAGGLKF
ncbi:MAG TPA: 50S ribosomal protein L18 [Opitutales bacterium]|jgi:large subunit ribosomal protein L18|nr:50S ribosomal protein L18 [Opitutales bacterium]